MFCCAEKQTPNAKYASIDGENQTIIFFVIFVSIERGIAFWLRCSTHCSIYNFSYAANCQASVRWMKTKSDSCATLSCLVLNCHAELVFFGLQFIVTYYRMHSMRLHACTHEFYEPWFCEHSMKNNIALNSWKMRKYWSCQPKCDEKESESLHFDCWMNLLTRSTTFYTAINAQKTIWLKTLSGCCFYVYNHIRMISSKCLAIAFLPTEFALIWVHLQLANPFHLTVRQRRIHFHEFFSNLSVLTHFYLKFNKRWPYVLCIYCNNINEWMRSHCSWPLIFSIWGYAIKCGQNPFSKIPGRSDQEQQHSPVTKT